MGDTENNVVEKFTYDIHLKGTYRKFKNYLPDDINNCDICGVDLIGTEILEQKKYGGTPLITLDGGKKTFHHVLCNTCRRFAAARFAHEPYDVFRTGGTAKIIISKIEETTTEEEANGGE